MNTPLKFSSEEISLLRKVYSFSKENKIKLFLVGGFLRDSLIGLKKKNPDFDFCLKENAISFGKKLSLKLKCGFFVLDKEHGACRLVKNTKDKVYTFDFTDFRGRDLEDDLIHRDFTCNALALALESVFESGDLKPFLIDPTEGIKDLRKKIIRLAGKEAFVEDPLRILRAFSFSAQLGFKIHPEVLKSARNSRKLLEKVSGERIRDELFKVFDSNDAYKHFALIDKLNILEVIFPEIKKMRGIGKGAYHHLDVWDHTMEALKQLEMLYSQFEKNELIRGFLDEVIAGPRKRRSLLKFGVLLHDIGKPKALRHKQGKIIFHGHERIGLDFTKEIVQRLKLSNDELNSLKTMVLWHLRPGYLGDQEELTPRAKFRYFRDTGKEALSVLLLSIADQRATRGPLTTNASRVQHEKTCLGLIKEYFRKQKQKKFVRLINGDDLISRFKLAPSPLFGKVLKEVEELQAIGKIRSKQEAFAQAGRIIKSQKA
ncbi:MAG: HD domain-containing protein [Candidatus Omnitrophica bacterium]|nr:HD domain-containing protein [Candidatus Omnitrophota bacterium]